MPRKGKLPWAKFYPEHWLNDAELAYCSLATRGAWIEWIARMLLSGRTGKLVGTLEFFAQAARCTVSEAKTALDDLKERKPTGKSAAELREKNGVVTLVNRRMRNEHNDRQGTKKRVERFRQKRKCNGESNGGEDRYSS